MPADVLLLFFTSAVLLALVPGPDNIFVLTQSLAHGSRAGLLVMSGLCTGLVLHTTLVAVGLAAVLIASPKSLFLIQLCGAGYLLYLAWRIWATENSSSQSETPAKLGHWVLYRRGIIMNITNPKVTLFFLAFLPQFVSEDYGKISLQIILLGFLFILSTILVFGALALLAGRFSDKLNKTERHTQILRRLTSLVFIVLAIKLIIDEP